MERRDNERCRSKRQGRKRNVQHAEEALHIISHRVDRVSVAIFGLSTERSKDRQADIAMTLLCCLPAGSLEYGVVKEAVYKEWLKLEQSRIDNGTQSSRMEDAFVTAEPSAEAATAGVHPENSGTVYDGPEGAMPRDAARPVRSREGDGELTWAIPTAMSKLMI